MILLLNIWWKQIHDNILLHLKITESIWNLGIQAYIMKFNSEENFVKETLLKILKISGV